MYTLDAHTHTCSPSTVCRVMLLLVPPGDLSLRDIERDCVGVLTPPTIDDKGTLIKCGGASAVGGIMAAPYGLGR